jgi:hypothetical protein
MTHSAKTIYYYSFYLFLMGLGLIIIPNQIISLFGFPNSEEIWIRILGLFTFTVGIYYYISARHEQTFFFKASVFGRVFFFIMMSAFVFIFNENPMLSVIGSVDIIGAAITYYALKK